MVKCYRGNQRVGDSQGLAFLAKVAFQQARQLGIGQLNG